MINEASILLRAVKTYGEAAQTDMAVEEMSELTKALLKYRRYGGEEELSAIREELADVSIMLDQMMIIYGRYSDIREEKLIRLERRMDAEEDRLIDR